MQRKDVFRSGRITVTENIIKDLNVRKVLEIGAGDYSFDYTKNSKSISWIKADFAKPCDVICDFNSDRLILPFAGGEFDLVICTEVVEHLFWPQRVLKESHRVLSHGGKILVSVPNVNSLTYRLAWLIGRIPSCAASGNLPRELGSTAYSKGHGELIGGHVIDFNMKRILGLLELSGFRTVVTCGSGIIWHRQILPHWIVPPSLSSNIICVAEKV